MYYILFLLVLRHVTSLFKIVYETNAKFASLFIKLQFAETFHAVWQVLFTAENSNFINAHAHAQVCF